VGFGQKCMGSQESRSYLGFSVVEEGIFSGRGDLQKNFKFLTDSCEGHQPQGLHIISGLMERSSSSSLGTLVKIKLIFYNIDFRLHSNSEFEKKTL